MEYNNKRYFGINKRIISFLHHLALLAMLHSSFVAPAQGIIMAYVNKGDILINYTQSTSGILHNPNDKDKNYTEKQPVFNYQPVNKYKTYNPDAVVSYSCAADIKEGIIGISKEKPIDAPSDNLFKVNIQSFPKGNVKIYLKYEVFGVANHQSVARSINTRQSVGGYLVKKQQGWSVQKEELDPTWLKEGENTILFTIAKAADYHYKVKNLSVEFEKANSVPSLLVVSSDVTMINNDNLYIKGFLRGNYPNAKIEISGTYLQVKNNEFEGYIKRNDDIKKNKFVVVKATNNGEFLGQELLFTDNILEADSFFPLERKEISKVKLFKTGNTSDLEIEGASIKVVDSALVKDSEVSITHLRNIDIAPLGAGLINVTKGAGGYRFLPDGMKFQKMVDISIAYDKLLIPAGYTEKDIKTYFFDTQSKRWIAIEKDSIDCKTHTIISKTNHFTDYINGIIQSPDSPETAEFAPTMMSDIKAADPSAEMTLISPPSASQKGDANISYPIKIPAGRNGMQPNLAIQYSSSGGDSWMGPGWNLNIPAITIDTRWGTPLFDPTKESEIYLLNGEQLMYEGDYLPNRHQGDTKTTITTEMQNRNTSGVKVFYPRKQGSFEKIERIGTSRGTYIWKVTGTDGTQYWYGGKGQTVSNEHIVRVGWGSDVPTNSISQWSLYWVEDIYGNYMKYTYDPIFPSNAEVVAYPGLHAARDLVIKQIKYTGYAQSEGNYSINFERESSIIREDLTIDGKSGVKRMFPYRLKSIGVNYLADTQNSLIRKYVIKYETGKLNKSRPQSITELSGDGQIAYTHNFEYYNDITKDGVDVYFATGIDTSICIEDDTACPDKDNDGVCDRDDACPDVPGLASNNGCPELQSNKCYTVTFPIPLTYQYNYTSPILYFRGLSCPSFPIYLESISAGGINYNTNKYLSFTNGGTCPPGTTQGIFYTIQNPDFVNDFKIWLGENLFSGIPVADLNVINQSYLGKGYEYAVTNYYFLNFQSTRSDLVINSTLGGIPQVYNGVMNVTPQVFNKTISSSGMNIPILINGAPLAQSQYNLQTGLNSFITAFRQQYGNQSAITSSEWNITITVPNSTNDFNNITVNGVNYFFNDCITPVSGGSGRFSTLSTPSGSGSNSGYTSYYDHIKNNFTIGFSGNVVGGNPNCPWLVNYDFLMQGFMPSFVTAPAALGSTKSESFSAGAYVGIGIGSNPVTKATTFGVQYTHGWDKGTGYVASVDITGDGLEDIVFREFDKLYYKKHNINRSYNAQGKEIVTHSFETKKLIQGIDNFYRSKGESSSFNFQVSAKAAVVGGFVGRDGSNSTSETNIYFTDANGDGLMDIVKNEVVYFNYISNGVPKFEPDSWNTENLVITAKPKDINVPEEYYANDVEFPEHDIVKVWEAPASGNIKITNNIELVDNSKEAIVTVESKKFVPTCYNVSFTPPIYYTYSYATPLYHYIVYNGSANCGDDAACFGGLSPIVTSAGVSGNNPPVPANLFLANGNVNGPLNMCPGGSYNICGNNPCSYTNNLDFNPRFLDFLENSLLVGIDHTDAYGFNMAVLNCINGRLHHEYGMAFRFYSNTPNITGGVSYKYPGLKPIENESHNEYVEGYQGYVSVHTSLQRNDIPHPLEVTVKIDGNTLGSFKIPWQFQQFKNSLTALYPGIAVNMNGGVVSISSMTPLTNISLTSTMDTSQTYVYDFQLGGCDLSTIPVTQPRPPVAKITPEIMKNYKFDEKEIERDYKMWIAEGNQLNAPIPEVSLANGIFYEGDEYIAKINKSDVLWSNADNVILTDVDLIKKLNTKLPFNIEKYYNSFQESVKDQVNEQRQDAYMAARAELQLNNDIKPDLHTLSEPTALRSCDNDQVDLCLLFGANMNNGNNVINNTITNYTSVCDIYQSKLYVNKGDKIYFRVHSAVNGNAKINWDPKIEYVNSASVTDQNGQNLSSSRYSEGFMISGSAPMVFPGNGTAQISWPAITVSNPSDDLTYEIYKKVITGSENGYNDIPETLIYQKKCLAGTTTSVTPGANTVSGYNISNLNVSGNTTNPNNSSVTAFYFRVKSTSNVRWKQWQWRPKVNCITQETIIDENQSSQGTTTISDIKYPLPDYTIYKSFPCSSPYSLYDLAQNTITGPLNMVPNLTGISFNGLKGVLHFVVKSNGNLIGKRSFIINGSSIAGDFSAFPITPGYTNLEIGYYTDDSNLLDNQESLLSRISSTDNPLATIRYVSSGALLVNVYRQNINLFHKPNQKFGTMYRQWGQFAYNPGAVTDAVQSAYGPLIKEDKLLLTDANAQQIIDATTGLDTKFDDANLETGSQSFLDEINQFEAQNQSLYNVPFIPLTASRNFSPAEGYQEKWQGLHTESYAGETTYRAANMAQAFTGIDDGSQETVQEVLKTGAYAITRYSKGKGTNLSAGANAGFQEAGVSVSIQGSKSLNGSNTMLTDYVDLNGDRYPDLISTESVQYTTKTGGLETKISLPNNYRGSLADYNNSSWGIGASASFSKGGKASPPSDPVSKRPKFVAFAGNNSTGISGNYSAGNSNASKLWTDINGDGMADMVSVDANGIVVVFMNLGHVVSSTAQQSFSAWGSFKLSEGRSQAIGGGIGRNIFGGSIELGVSLNKAVNHSDFSLMDMNGDGMVDIVRSHDNALKVKLNRGADFAPEIIWSDYNLNNQSETVTMSKNAGFTFAWVFGIPFTGIALKLIDVNANGSPFGTSTNNTKKNVTDYDGDGYPDLLEEISSGTVRIRSSNIKRTDLLKSVTNPLGGKFTVDYNVVTPTYNNPNAKWVMSDVIVEDGYDIVNDGVDTYRKKYEYQNPRYDRREREFYGFETIKALDYNVDSEGKPQSVYRTNETTYYNNSYFLNGLVKETKLYRGIETQQLFSTSVNYYDIRKLDASGYINLTGVSQPLTYDTGGREGRRSGIVLLNRTESYIYELGQNPLATSVSFTYNKYGSILQYTNFGAASSLDDYTTVINYHNTPDLVYRNLINIPQEVKVFAGTGTNQSTPLRKRTTEINPARGSVTKVTVQLNNDFDEAVTDIEYDIYGNIKKVTKPANHNGQRMFYDYTYDTVNNKYIVKTEDAFGYISTGTFDPKFDKPLSGTSITGDVVTYTYDNFGRTTTVTSPYDQGAPYTIKFGYYPVFSNVPSGSYCVDLENFVPFATTSHLDTFHQGNDIETVTLVDGLARPIQVKKDIELNRGNLNNPDYYEAMSISGMITYDEFGRAIKQYHPWSENKQCDYSYKPNSYDTTIHSETFYDEADRPVQINDAEGNQSFNSYSIDYDNQGNRLLKTITSIPNLTDTTINEVFKDITGKTIATKNVLTGMDAADIWTRFTYNAVGELISYMDAAGLSTTYKYDMAGRKIELLHPDNGKTTYVYDTDSNMIKMQTLNLEAYSALLPEDRFIKYNYDFNRLSNKISPSEIPEINSEETNYSYGNGGNEKGRISRIDDMTGYQHFYYDSMGRVVYNDRVVTAPNLPTRSFTQEFAYDSWNRLIYMSYPDGEYVLYNYNLGGNLISMTGYYDQEEQYIKQIDYDYFGNKIALKSGNNTETYYKYTQELQRLSNVNSYTSSQEEIMNNTYEYDKIGNIININNAAGANHVNGLGGGYLHTYQYDNLNRLIHAEGKFGGDMATQQPLNNDYNALYSLDMRYTPTHGIAQKMQSHIKNDQSVPANTYINTYEYPTDSHKVQKISDPSTGVDEDYYYDANGNITYKYNNITATDRTFYWDESNRLSAIIDGQGMQHYIYDGAGERVLKASAQPEQLYNNGMPVDGTYSFDAYTTYPSGYIVVNGDGVFSKHYYAGSQRIVSRVGDLDASIFEYTIPRRGTSTDSESSPDPDKIRKKQIDNITRILAKAKKGTPVFKKYEPAEEDEELDGITDEGTKKKENGYTPKSNPGGDIYYYHPDHLGSSTYLTDANGDMYQIFLNLPFGETMAEQHSLTEDYATPYKFNGKELDSETGLYYYGARYYDPRTSIWLSTDPLMEKYPNVNPYAYCVQNPVKYIDPDGENPILGALIGAFTEYAGIIGSKMLFEDMTFMDANRSLTWTDGMDIGIAAGFGAASGALDGGITKFSSWIAKPTNQKIVKKLLEVGVSALESSLKQIYKDEDFDLKSILVGALTEVGMGDLLKTDVYKEAAAEASQKAGVATRKAEDLARRGSPNQRLVKNAQKEAAAQAKTAKSFEKLDARGKLIKGSVSKTSANKTQELSKPKSEL